MANGKSGDGDEQFAVVVYVETKIEAEDKKQMVVCLPWDNVFKTGAEP